MYHHVCNKNNTAEKSIKKFDFIKINYFKIVYAIFAHISLIVQ